METTTAGRVRWFRRGPRQHPGHRWARWVGVTVIAATVGITQATATAGVTQATAPIEVPPPSATVAGVPATRPVDLLLLQPVPEDVDAYVRAGVDQVTLELGWDAYEPRPGVLNTEYLDRRIAEARTYQAAGIDVVLDLGLQYPPAWVWDLPGSTRFVNQFGATWHGGIGTDPVNAVWNLEARAAQERAVEHLAHYTADIDFTGVRIGGLLSGELRLPPSEFDGRRGSLWGFDASARSTSPLPDYVPGQGTPAQAATWADWYVASLTDYQSWLTRTVHTAFPDAVLHVLLPGWGLRPGEAEAAVADRLSAESVAATGDNLSSGIDWARQVEALGVDGLPVLLTTTWIDAPEYGTAPRDLAPVDYLAGLAEPWGLPVSGENTGGGGVAALDRALAQARKLGLTQVTWMSATALRDGPVTLEQLGAAFAGTG